MDILVPTDGSEWGNRAVRAACRIARSDDVIHVLHVVDVRFIRLMTGGLHEAMVMPENTEPDEALEAYRQEASAILDECGSLCSEAGVRFRLKQTIGIPRKVILALAEESDLLVLAKRGFSPLRLSRRTRWILQRTSRPALAVTRSGPFNKLLLAYDGGLGSDELIEFICLVFAGRPLQVVLLCVGPEMREDGGRARSAADALTKAGFEVTVEHPTEKSYFAALLAAQGHQPDLVAVCGPAPGFWARFARRQDVVTYVAEGVDAAVLALRP